MSDPVSNADIEDVLSSIRRLVSDEPVDAPERDPDAADSAVERFVLTPAFRVTEDDADEPVENSAHSVVPDAQTEVSEIASDHAENVHEFAPVHTNLESLDGAATVAETSETSAAKDGDELNSQISVEYQSDEEWSDEAIEANPDEAVQAAEQEKLTEELAAQNASPPMDSSLEERIAELEAAIEQTPQEWEPDGSEEILDDETTPISLNLVNSNDDADLMNAITGVEAESPESTLISSAPEPISENESLEPDDQTLADPIAASDSNVIETPVAEIAAADHETTPDAEIAADVDESPLEELDSETLSDLAVEASHSAFDEVGDATSDIGAFEAEDVLGSAEMVDLSDPAESEMDMDETPARDVTPEEPEADEFLADPVDPAMGAASGGTEPDDGNFLADDEAALDEDSLRAMIADLVREELQGVLGERITRNVRRLVRREIQRALAMRDLE